MLRFVSYLPAASWRDERIESLLESLLAPYNDGRTATIRQSNASIRGACCCCRPYSRSTVFAVIAAAAWLLRARPRLDESQASRAKRHICKNFFSLLGAAAFGSANCSQQALSTKVASAVALQGVPVTARVLLKCHGSGATCQQQRSGREQRGHCCCQRSAGADTGGI